MQSRIHINLSVSDLKSSIEFYQKLFRQPASKIKSDYANFRLDEPALHLALIHQLEQKLDTDKKQQNRIHYGVELFSNEKLQQWQQQVEQQGLVTKIQKAVACCYATGNKFWVQDPDGHDWEFWVKLDEAQQLHESDAEKNQSTSATCC